MAGSERGCPELQGSQLLWTHEACSWTAKSADYRALQELAYVNHAGVPVESIYVLMTAFPLVLMAHQSCGPLGTPAPPLAKALWDAVVVVLPLTFHFSAHLEQPLLLLLLATSILELRRCSKGGLSWQATFSLDNDRLRFVSEYRALVMMSTCVAILAVDFSSVFSRAQAKTEEFGYSLMDVGTGSIIFSSGVCTMPKRGGASRLYKIMKLWPVLLIGFVRAALMWGIDYHVPPGEYGIHWNFFFTIAVISLVSTATDLSALASATAASLALGAYQFYLSWLGGANFVLHAERLGLFTANREGILSSAGYLSLHWFGVAVGSTLRNSGALRCVLQLFLLAAAGYFVNLTLSFAGLEASRRMCNLPYVLFTVSLNAWVLALLGSVDLLAGRPRTAMSLSVAGVQDSMLPVFLFANLLTGAVNLLLQPLMVPFWPAMAVMFGYCLLWSVPAAMLRLQHDSRSEGMD